MEFIKNQIDQWFNRALFGVRCKEVWLCGKFQKFSLTLEGNRKLKNPALDFDFLFLQSHKVVDEYLQTSYIFPVTNHVTQNLDEPKYYG